MGVMVFQNDTRRASSASQALEGGSYDGRVRLFWLVLAGQATAIRNRRCPD
jgi:hypothetical protein